LGQRGLVAEVGRMEGVGRPILYGVTELFMQHFGLLEMRELPPLEETEADRLWAATVIDESGTAEGKAS
jgi:segregation and condensation protein B